MVDEMYQSHVASDNMVTSNHIISIDIFSVAASALITDYYADVRRLNLMGSFRSSMSTVRLLATGSRGVEE